MIWVIVGSIAPSLIIALLCGYLVRKLAPRFGLIDQPTERKAHRSPVPLGGGLAIWAGVVGAFLAGQIALNSLVRSSYPVGTEPVQQAVEHNREQGNRMHAVTRGNSKTCSGNCKAAETSEFLRIPLRQIGRFVTPHVPGLRQQSGKLWTLLAAATLMMLLGLIDDQRGLDWRLRICVQTLVAAFMVWQGWRLSVFVDAPWLTSTLSVIWIVGLVNTFNMLDNMDGLAAGVAAIVAALLATVILTAPDPITQGPQLFVGGFLLVLVGALLGFLWHNWPPARLFMGDAGSYFIGFCLATATISATFAGEGLPRHAILAPLCVLAVPIYDTVTVVWIRLREGRSPFAADRNHVSHRLVELGFSPRSAVLLIYAATVVCGASAFFLHRVGEVGALVILGVIAAVLAAVAAVELTSRRLRLQSSSVNGRRAG